eukprot:c16481_g2_i1 orf=352-612(+)
MYLMQGPSSAEHHRNSVQELPVFQWISLNVLLQFGSHPAELVIRPQPALTVYLRDSEGKERYRNVALQHTQLMTQLTQFRNPMFHG